MYQQASMKNIIFLNILSLTEFEYILSFKWYTILFMHLRFKHLFIS